MHSFFLITVSLHDTRGTLLKKPSDSTTSVITLRRDLNSQVRTTPLTKLTAYTVFGVDKNGFIHLVELQNTFRTKCDAYSASFTPLTIYKMLFELYFLLAHRSSSGLISISSVETVKKGFRSSHILYPFTVRLVGLSKSDRDKANDISGLGLGHLHDIRRKNRSDFCISSQGLFD